MVRKFWPVLALLTLGCFAVTGCSSEPAAAEGDAEVVKQTEKNENPAAMGAREQAGAAGGSNSAAVEPPPGN